MSVFTGLVQFGGIFPLCRKSIIFFSHFEVTDERFSRVVEGADPTEIYIILRFYVLNLVLRSTACVDTKAKPRARRGKEKSFGILIQSFNNRNKTRILTDTVIATVL